MIKPAYLKQDLPASVVVFFVALPLCLGIALASGAPLFSGLIAGVVGGVVVGSISRSRLGVSGPAAGLAVIVLGAIQSLGSFEAFLLAVMIAGLMQIALGVLRAGVLGYFFPTAVIHGMLCGIGLIIVLKQIPHALGYDANPEGDLAFVEQDGGTTLSALVEMLGQVSPQVAFVSLTGIAILLLWDRVLASRHKLFKLLPGPLAAVAFGVGYQIATLAWAPGWAIDATHLVAVPVIAGFDGLANLLVMPDFSLLGSSEIYMVAATIAVVASLETLLSVEATDKMDPLKRTTPTNRELVAQGVGNTVSGLLGGLPITQVIVRSSANVMAGAQSRASTIIHGVLLLVCVALLPTVLNMIPLGVLAAVLLLTGYKLAQPALFRRMWTHGHEQFLPFIVTVLGVVFTDLLTGVGLGMAVGIMIILQRNYLNSHFLHIQQADTRLGRHLVTMRLAEEVTFLNKGAIKKELSQIPDGSVVVIDRSNCVYVNHDINETIADFIKTAPARAIEVRIVEAPVLERKVEPLRVAA
jgi:MFS superfamily sulfate permease-like transporter